MCFLIGIAVGQELEGASEVCEQHRDPFALPFEGTLGGEDFVGEVLRSIGLRRLEA